MRLDRLLSNAGLGSRKDVRKLIRQGGVTRDGECLSDPALDIPETDYQRLLIKGQAFPLIHTVHLILNKPAGYITATRDVNLPHVLQLIDEVWDYAKLFPVGRLDRDTTGLLLLTNDGQLAHRLTSPKWEVAKEYFVVVRGTPFTKADVAQFAAGLILDDGPCKPATLTPRSDYTATLTLHEGRFHQVKRMMLATGREVIRLERRRFGTLDLSGLSQPSHYRLLDEKEIKELYDLVELHPPEI
ncbi:MAG TPA: rRNA pseudouridine synthase [Clostridiaceae bacterium]|nr:rRNA pseudouridine synthase [Clostridiaceae bacterium]